MILRVSVAIFLLIAASCKNGGNTLHPQTKPLMEAVYASGFVRSQGEYEVFSQGEGYVLKKLVSDGDRVRQGDPLFVLDAGQQSARYQIARENYRQAVEQVSENSPVLREIRAALRTSESKMKFDSVNYVRYSNLLNNHATSKVEYDRMKLAYENSRNEFVLYQSRLAKIKSDLEVALENTRQQLLIAGDESGRYIIRSMVTGRVFQTQKVVGELVRRGEPVATVGEQDVFYLELTVDELDLNKIKVGQQVLVKADAFADKLFQATVTKIYPLVDARQQSIRIDAEFQEQLPVAFSGLAVEANIIIRQKEKAMVVPKSVLLTGDSVWILSNGNEVKVKVIRGIETLDEVEVVSGLQEESILILK